MAGAGKFALDWQWLGWEVVPKREVKTDWRQNISGCRGRGKMVSVFS